MLPDSIGDDVLCRSESLVTVSLFGLPFLACCLGLYCFGRDSLPVVIRELLQRLYYLYSNEVDNKRN